MIPMGPPYGYPGDFDRNSSGEAGVNQTRGGIGLEGSKGAWEIGSAQLCYKWQAVTDNQSLLVGGHSSQVPLLREVDGSVSSGRNLLF